MQQVTEPKSVGAAKFLRLLPCPQGQDLDPFEALEYDGLRPRSNPPICEFFGPIAAVDHGCWRILTEPQQPRRAAHRVMGHAKEKSGPGPRTWAKDYSPAPEQFCTGVRRAVLRGVLRLTLSFWPKAPAVRAGGIEPCPLIPAESLVESPKCRTKNDHGLKSSL